MTTDFASSGPTLSATPASGAGAGLDIAIVGMAAHLPGAQDVGQFWHNLRHGIESIRPLSHAELLAAGEDPALIDRPDYVPSAAPLDGFADFDADFFGLSPKDAAIMDPQHRQFLEVAWEALEHAAHPPETEKGRIGVFAGCGQGTYYWVNLRSNPDLMAQTGAFLLRHTGNDKDFLSTRVSHIFDLTGPSVNVQTACSTSLVAIHYAVQALLGGECDMALAGGVTIELPHLRGYLFKEGEILSPDGHCHAFDHRAQGTVFGSGAGCVVLRRLEDAQRDGDHIWAVIKGTAINNDGAAKAGYLAPSVDGQARAIAEAHVVADVAAETVDYIECHGTGTYLGDPIEVAALTEAFRRSTDAEDFCRIGSVKTNIGHTDTAAGVASVIKTALALHHREMPPSLGYEAPNPAIDFDGSPFRVNDSLTPWPKRAHPPRAGVNSLGVGGTNAHAVLQAAPPRAPSDAPEFPFHLLTLSARSKTALAQAGENLARHLDAIPDADDKALADIAFTLHKGRRAFDRRAVIVARDAREAAALLRSGDSRKLFTHSALHDPDVVFMFPGGGAQYAGMARDLYETEPVFRDWMDRGLEILQPKLDYDIRALWLPHEADRAAADQQLLKPSVQLPLIMITEYALAKLWMAWGVTPSALIGHSMGENTAACLAGVMSFTDCIGLVHLRGQLFDTVPAGGMVSVPLSEAALAPYLTGDLDLASVNAPNLCVASGPDAALDDLVARLAAEGIQAQRIAINIAAHSRMLDPILARFEDYLRTIPLHAPAIPLISNRSGAMLTADQATDPAYWVAHLRGTVRFLDGLNTLSTTPDRIFIEVGPGRAMASLAGQHGVITPNQVVHSLRHPDDPVADDAFFISQLGRIWALGGQFDWAQYWGPARRNRVPLPTYPFQRATYFIAPREGAQALSDAPPLSRLSDMADWAALPHWAPDYPAGGPDPFDPDTRVPAEDWLIFADQGDLATRLNAKITRAGGRATLVHAGDAFARLDDGHYRIAAELAGDYDRLWADLAARDRSPARIVHLWHVTQDDSFRPGSSFFHRLQEHGFWSLLHLAQAIGPDSAPLHLLVAQNGAASLHGKALPHPAKATALGPAQVIPREFPAISVACVDLEDGPDPLPALWAEALAQAPKGRAAWRGGLRFTQSWRETALPAADIALQGPVLITGGFGGMGLSIAKALAARGISQIALLGRREMPPRKDWATHPDGPSLREIEALGATVLPLSGDVASLDDMRAAVASAVQAFGPIKGLIHAAGTINDAPILGKSPLAAEDVLAPKVHGTQVLWQVLPDLAWAALCASTSSITAPVGQVDYVAANAFLNAFASAHDRPERRVIAVNWGIWAETGMAAKALAGQGTSGTRGTPVSNPLFDRIDEAADGTIHLIATWDESRWFIDEHRTKAGEALLPGTGYLELAAQAMQLLGEDLPFTLHDLTFLSPLHVAGSTDLHMTLSPHAHGYDVTVKTRHDTLVHAEGTITFDTTARPAAIPPPVFDAADCAAEGRTLSSAQEAHLAFGPRWRTLQARRVKGGHGVAKLHLPPTGAEGMLLHPGLMDFATGWATEFAQGYTAQTLWVPLSYGEMRVFGPISAGAVFSHVASHAAGAGRARFDITLTDATGAVLVTIRDFTMQRLEGPLAMPVAEKTARTLSPAEETLRQSLALGIRPDEGAEAFLRAMAKGKPQVAISSIPLKALIAKAEARDDAAEGQTFARPDLDSVFTPPEGEVETRLAAFWAELLGITDVGAEDSFFDLGGHSLIAVRLMAMVKKAFAIDLPISVLFEAATIRRLGAVIVQAGFRPSDGSATAAPSAPPQRFTHIVPMHQGTPPAHATPFFLVAGMFGNVMNLRQLGLILGQDRAVYGLQARGLFGDAPPHDSLVEAARDLIAEIRQIQPTGPYLLGGFSGGGLTAYEIARQLHAAGEKVADIVMLDTPLARRRPLRKADKVMMKLQDMREGGLMWPYRWIKDKIAYRRAQAQPKRDGDATAFHNAAIEAAFYTAISQYETHAWDGPLVLYRPAPHGKWRGLNGALIDQDRAYVLPDNDWGPYAPQLMVNEVPGDHDSMVLEPHVRVLSRRIRARLSHSDTRRTRSQNRQVTS